MPTPEIETSAYGVAGGAAIAVLVGAYRAMRGMKADRRTDTLLDDLRKQMLENLSHWKEERAGLQDQLKAQYALLVEERRRTDLFAKERMELSTHVGILSTKVDELESKLRDLRDERAALRVELAQLESNVATFQAINAHLVDESVQFRALMEAEGLRDAYERINRRITQGRIDRNAHVASTPDKRTA